MTVSDEARELARKAKAELIRRGRFKGGYADIDQIFFGANPGNCRVCVLGAISAADGQDPRLGLRPNDAVEQVVIGLAERVGRQPWEVGYFGADPVFDWGTDVDTVADWHDRDTTTDDDVYRLLDAIAEAS